MVIVNEAYVLVINVGTDVIVELGFGSTMC